MERNKPHVSPGAARATRRLLTPPSPGDAGERLGILEARKTLADVIPERANPGRRGAGSRI